MSLHNHHQRLDEAASWISLRNDLAADFHIEGR